MRAETRAARVRDARLSQHSRNSCLCSPQDASSTPWSSPPPRWCSRSSENADDAANTTRLSSCGCDTQIGIYYYLTKRWFQRNKFETMLQFALVFIFFPGVFLLSPFLNFRPEKPGTQLDDPIIM
jgi:hypothetical protein